MAMTLRPTCNAPHPGLPDPMWVARGHRMPLLGGRHPAYWVFDEEVEMLMTSKWTVPWLDVDDLKVDSQVAYFLICSHSLNNMHVEGLQVSETLWTSKVSRRFLVQRSHNAHQPVSTAPAGSLPATAPPAPLVAPIITVNMEALAMLPHISIKKQLKARTTIFVKWREYLVLIKEKRVRQAIDLVTNKGDIINFSSRREPFEDVTSA
uniref:Uncharacterized protein n=1 Tax=Oryza sativa subsp. japonica TaxID=39947 RepID=Q5Z7A9_ORYSJ|nr:hypothetical protein [Oryza sativa Japonica Group]